MLRNRLTNILQLGCRIACSRLVALVPLAAFLTWGPSAAVSQMTPALPNIVVVLADDIGLGDIAPYNPSLVGLTPNLDRLAQEGMRFTHAHSSAAVCAPSRYSALTGNYHWRGRREWGTWRYYHPSQVLPGQWTIGDMLRFAGYRTALVGKLHLGGDFMATRSTEITRDPARADISRPFGGGPLAHGFDYSFNLLEGIQNPPYAYFENDALYGDPALLRRWDAGAYGNSRVPSAGIGMSYWDSSRVGEDLLTRALGFIDGHVAAFGTTRPFFLYYAAAEAHPPLSPPDAFFGQPIRGISQTCSRDDMIHQLDLAVGILIDRLRAHGLLGNTLFVFASDNGSNPANCRDSTGSPFSGYKGQVLEGGHRVPMIVRWGDAGIYAVPPGSIRTQAVGVQDLAATLAAVARVPVPPEQALDSFNLLPLLLGQRDDLSPVRDHLIAEARKETKLVGSDPLFAYYEADWKLVARRTVAGFEADGLFNLTQDPAELNDLLAIERARATEMLERFKLRHAGPRSAPWPG
jgi:arylsulfatase A-like enzyme